MKKTGIDMCWEDVREMAKEFNKRFDGRGGGKPEMVQGTVRGEKEAIERWLMKYEFVCIQETVNDNK